MTELKLTPKMLARVLYEAHAEDLAEKTAAMTEAEKDAALAKMGKSRAGLKASLAARRARYEAEAKKEPSRGVPLAPRRIVRWAAGSGLAAGLSLAAAFLAIFLSATHQHITEIKPATTGASPGSLDLSDPLTMRYEGMSFCAVGDYAQCLEWLDRAYAKDPSGELAWPRVQIARKRAMDALAANRDH